MGSYQNHKRLQRQQTAHRFDTPDSSEPAKLRQLEEQPQPLVLQQHHVSSTLRRINTKKAAQPDTVSGRVLKLCLHHLAEVFLEIFNLSLQLALIPVCLKTCITARVTAKSSVTCLNDYRSVVLTAAVMKYFERIVLRCYPNGPQTVVCLLGELNNKGYSLTSTAHGRDSPGASEHQCHDFCDSKLTN